MRDVYVKDPTKKVQAHGSTVRGCATGKVKLVKLFKLINSWILDGFGKVVHTGDAPVELGSLLDSLHRLS